MEKVYYLLGRPAEAQLAAFHQALLSDVISTIRAIGGQQITVHLTDLDDEIQARSAQRIIGPWDEFGGALSFWLPSEHLRKVVEEQLKTLTDTVSGYLVTEAVWQEREWQGQDGERRPGVCLLGGIGKQPGLTDHEFFRIWEQHSHNSFDLHPFRQSYSRHTVARQLSEGAPNYQGIILEQFPDMDVFTDNEKFYNIKEAKRINDFALTMIDRDCFFSGGVSEYHFA